MKHLSRLAAAVCLFTSSVRSDCSNTHDGVMLFSVSINGYSVDQIGRTEYLDVIDTATEAIMQTSDQTVGIQSFAGDGGSGTSTADTTYFTDILPITSATSAVSSAIQGLIGSDFDVNYGNSVSRAMDNAIDLFASVLSTRQKYHVLFSAGNPLQGSIGTTTNAGNYDDPCSNARDAKNANIQTMVALIGEQGRNFVKEYYSCLVEDPATDVIIIDPLSPATGIALLKARVCKANGYDVRITEVNPTTGGLYRPFIEIFNRGASVSLKACWNTATGSCSSASAVSTGQYYVAACSGCDGDNPGQDNGNLIASPSGSTGWTAVAATVTTELDSVTHGSGDYWQTFLTGRSFELRGVGFNNQYGGNWRASCNSALSIGGSPGAATAPCVATENSCSELLDQCTANGGSGSQCSSGGDSNKWCTCSTSFLGDVDTCIAMPTPPNSCTAYVITDRLGALYTHFAIGRTDWDEEVSYTLNYFNGASSGSTKVCGAVNMGAVNDGYNTGSSITMIAEYTSPLSLSSRSVETSMVCTIVTQQPTKEPTAQPTPMPTPMPVVAPTQSPTFGQVGVFLRSSDFCAVGRCDCFGEAQNCCDGNGNLPSSGSCDDQLWPIEIAADAESTTEETVTLETYADGGADYDLGLMVNYTITAYGTFNLSNYESLAWAVRNGNTSDEDILSIDVSPPGSLNGSAELSVEILSGDTTDVIALAVSTSTLKCEADEECIGYDECLGTAIGFVIEVTGCSSEASQGGCLVMYPNKVFVAVSRSNELCAIIYGVGNEEEDLPDWFWWVLIALLVFLICLCWLVYRFWWSQKKTAAELGDAENELDQQHADNEAGFGGDLNHGDVVFNPIATGVPGMDRPADAFGNEIQQRQQMAQNDMVDVQAEVFQVRQDYGQVQTGQPRGGM